MQRSARPSTQPDINDMRRAPQSALQRASTNASSPGPEFLAASCMFGTLPSSTSQTPAGHTFRTLLANRCSNTDVARRRRDRANAEYHCRKLRRSKREEAP